MENKNNKAARAYLDSYGNLKAIGYNAEGEVNFNPDPKIHTDSGKRRYDDSVDVAHLGLYRDGSRFLPTGMKEGEGLTIKRDDTGNIYSKEGFRVDDVLKEVYALAEAKKAERM